jgi:hypothetical protein
MDKVMKNAEKLADIEEHRIKVDAKNHAKNIKLIEKSVN